MRCNPLCSSRGTTLIELLISTTISVAMVGFVGVIYQNASQHYVGNREKSQTQMRSRLSIDFLAQELRNAGYILSWDPNPVAPPLAINQPIPGAAVDANTESITIRYALAPLTATLSGAPIGNLLTVNALPFSMPANSLIAIYSPPSTVNVRRVAAAVNVGDLTITLMTAPENTFNAGNFVTPVVENSFWVEGGNLMMRSGGNNQRLSGGVEDLQVALINKDQTVTGDVSSDGFAGMTTTQILDTRAIRLSLTGRSKRILSDKKVLVPPSLEDHDRSGEPPDRLVRKVQQTTTYLRNMGVLDP